MTMADLLLAALVRAQIGAALAIVVVLLLRGPARMVIGAELSYRLWSAAPVAAVVGLFPTLSDSRHGYPITLLTPPAHAGLLLQYWAAGAAAMVALMALSELRFRRLASRGKAGPAVMGLSWPRIIIPQDYEQRFTAAERDLILRHERTHIARRDPGANLFIAAMQVVGWFNPLVHVAARCARLDQELACDAAVVECRPELRRDYGATLLKAHAATPSSPFACGWSPPGRHPLEIRLSMLARPPLSLPNYIRGAMAVALTAFVVGVVVWSVAPAGYSGETFVWRQPPAIVYANLAP
ncbi:MAG TPA: M56 family metallopeptidase [Caulobacteraceae bacterium]|jgi:beta-lactamase regulating signal transducer with metallopeptidase domain|nr:M56 family metallopeptidase [Caulobacteraceae bacterium]